MATSLLVPITQNNPFAFVLAETFEDQGEDSCCLVGKEKGDWSELKRECCLSREDACEGYGGGGSRSTSGLLYLHVPAFLPVTIFSLVNAF